MPGLANVHIRIDQFEGPLPLLLQLIEREQLEVTRVSVVAVADSFLALVSRAQETDLSTIGEFIGMAARLLVIKSRALLRTPVDAPAESLEPDDADALARQIADYRRYQQVASWLADRRTQHLLALPRPPARTIAIERRPIVLALPSIHRAAIRLLTPPPIGIREDEWPQVDYHDVRLGLMNALAAARKATFVQLCGDARHPLVVITLFLAVLDTVRAQLVYAEQPEPFGAITLRAAARSGHGIE
jgi:segregation and condensation protein A